LGADEVVAVEVETRRLRDEEVSGELALKV